MKDDLEERGEDLAFRCAMFFKERLQAMDSRLVLEEGVRPVDERIIYEIKIHVHERMFEGGKWSTRTHSAWLWSGYLGAAFDHSLGVVLVNGTGQLNLRLPPMISPEQFFLNIKQRIITDTDMLSCADAICQMVAKAMENIGACIFMNEIMDAAQDGDRDAR